MPVSGSKPEPGQLTPPEVFAMLIAPRYFCPGPVSTGGTKGDCSQRNFFRFSSACACSCGVKSITSLSATNVREYGGGTLGTGCVAAVFSPGMSLCGAGFSGIGQMG